MLCGTEGEQAAHVSWYLRRAMDKKQSIVPPELLNYYRDWHMSPGLTCQGFVFLTGVNGTRPDGTISTVPAEQIRQAFLTVEDILTHGGLRFENVVEMTTYHVCLHDHIDLFCTIRDEFVVEPFPAWTAIEVSGLITKEALVEIRIIACQDST